MATSRTTHRYVGRRWKIGLRPRPLGKTRQICDIFLQCVPFRFRLMSPLLPSSLRSAALTNFAHPFFAVKGESLFESTFWKPGTSSEVRGYDYGVSSVRTLPLSPIGGTARADLQFLWPVEPRDHQRLRTGGSCSFKPYALGGTNNHSDKHRPKCWMLDSLMEPNSAHAVSSLPPLSCERLMELRPHVHQCPQDRLRWRRV